MKVYLGKQGQIATEETKSTHGIVLQLIRKVEGLGHKICMDSYVSFALYDDLLEREISSCGTVHSDKRGMPQEIRHKSMKLKKRGYYEYYKSRGASKCCSLERRDVYVLTNMHRPPVDGNLRDEFGHAVKLHVIADYSKHIGFVDKPDRMVNRYGISWTWKWTKKLFFHVLHMTILNAYLLH
jgi:hypothetical protein